MPRKSPPNLGSMAYLRLLNLVGAIQRGQPALDPIEERLLNRMATAWHRGERVSVTEAMDAQEGLAPATVHRRLKRLREKGLIGAKENVKILTSCPACLQGLSRYGEDTQNGLLEADYIVVEMANQILGKNWMREYVDRANNGGIERVLV